MDKSVLVDDDGAVALLAQRVVDENRAAGRNVAMAESCTGGMVSAALTDVAGSSDVFRAGFVTYADDVKQQLLGVHGDIIETFGAVSMACAWAMARGAQARADADVAVAVSGIAGPGGGSDAKPVGTVVFALANRGDGDDSCDAIRKNFPPELGRAGIRREATLYALSLLLPGATTGAVCVKAAP